MSNVPQRVTEVRRKPTYEELAGLVRQYESTLRTLWFLCEEGFELAEAEKDRQVYAAMLSHVRNNVRALNVRRRFLR